MKTEYKKINSNITCDYCNQLADYIAIIRKKVRDLERKEVEKIAKISPKAAKKGYVEFITYKFVCRDHKRFLDYKEEV